MTAGRAGVQDGWRRPAGGLDFGTPAPQTGRDTREEIYHSKGAFGKMRASWDNEIEELGGLLSVLNVGAGDIEIRFDRADAAEVAQAKRIIADMLARGYTILVKDGDALAKVTGFDSEKELYFVRGTEASAPEVAHGGEPTPGAGEASTLTEPDQPTRRGRSRGSRKGIPMRTAQATGIGPTAGG